MFHKTIFIEQKNCISKTIMELKRYIKKKKRNYRDYEVSEFLRFQEKSALELRSIFGDNNPMVLKVEELELSVNEENKVTVINIENVLCELLGIMQGALSTLKTHNNKKKYQVFISSTYKDLIEYRQAAYDIITSEGHFPAGMENFIATNNHPEEYIKRVIDESDYYILIIGQRYGSMIKSGEMSFTEMEYEYAKSKNIKIIPLIYKGKKPLFKNIDNSESLIKFKNKVESENVIQYFSDPKELKLNINQALNEVIRNHPMPGWIKNKS